MSDRDSAWGTAVELAGLPGVPQTPRGVHLFAERIGLQKRKCAVGKGFEYHLGLLPVETRTALQTARAQSGEVVVVTTAEPPALIPQPKEPLAVLDLKKWQRDILDARLVILREVEQRTVDHSVSEAVDIVVALAADKTLPTEVQKLVPVALAKSKSSQESLSVSTLNRWRAMKKRGLASLAPVAMDMGRTPDWVDSFMKFYRSTHRPTAAAAIRLMREQGVDARLIPTYSQALRHLKQIGEVEQGRGRLSKLELCAKLPFIRRDTSMLKPMDIINGDGHLFYALVMHPNTGKGFSPEVTECFDVATRYHLGWSINFSENTHAVMDSLRMAALFGGVPRIVHWDNGSGAKNKNLQDEVTGLKNRVGFEFYHQSPGNPQAGGIVERGHQQVMIPAAKRFETFVGRREKNEGLLRIKSKQLREGKIRLPSVEEVVAVIDALRDQYNRTPHSALPWLIDPVTNQKRHETPMEAWQRHVDEGWRPVTIDDPLEEFRLEETRTVIRGEIRFHTMIYSDRVGLKDFHNQKVRVRYDPRDGSKVWVWSLDKHDRFICEATKDANLHPYLVESVQEHGEAKRLRGQLNRLDRKRQEKLDEAKKTLELQAEPLTIEQDATATAMIEHLQMDRSKEAEVIPLYEDTVLVNGTIRPIFSGPLAEEQWGHWALANVEALDEEELDQLEAKMESPRFRMLLGIDDEDAETNPKKKTG